MSQDLTHRGIAYAVRHLGERRWKWEIDPPAGIKGLRSESGEIEGEIKDAVTAARKAIETQTAIFSR